MSNNESIETAKATEEFAYTDYTAEAKTETQSEVTQAKQEVEEAIDIADEPIKAKPNAYETFNDAYATLNNAYETFNDAYATLNNAYATFNNADPTNDNANAPTDNANAPTDHIRESARMLSRADILDCAKLVVNGEREKQYGKPEDNFAIIAKLWSAYKGDSFTPLDVAMMMALLKIARIRTGVGTADSFVDLAGYAACAGEIAGRS